MSRIAADGAAIRRVAVEVALVAAFLFTTSVLIR
jgi:hypothetical protein